MDFYPYEFDDIVYVDDWDRQLGMDEPFSPFQGPGHGPGPGRPPGGPRPPRPRPRPRPPFFQPMPPVGPWPDGSQGIRRCQNRVTMIALNSGQLFWFFIEDVAPEWVRGFRWTRTGWIRDRIWRRNIRWFDCQ